MITILPPHAQGPVIRGSSGLDRRQRVHAPSVVPLARMGLDERKYRRAHELSGRRGLARARLVECARSRPPCATGPNPTDRGKRGLSAATERHLVVDANRIPLATPLTAAKVKVSLDPPVSSETRASYRLAWRARCIMQHSASEDPTRDGDMPRSFSYPELRRAVGTPAVEAIKCVIVNLLEEMVRREHRVDTSDDLLEAAELSGNYRSLGSYPMKRRRSSLMRPEPSIFLPTPSSTGPGVDAPSLDHDTSPEDRLLMGHCPPLRMCAPAEGFTQGEQRPATARRWRCTVQLHASR